MCCVCDAVCALPSALLCPTCRLARLNQGARHIRAGRALPAQARAPEPEIRGTCERNSLALSPSSLARSHEQHAMSSPRGGREQEASQPCPSTRHMPPVFQGLRREQKASQPCSSRQHRLTCWHVLHAASGPSHALARFPATSVLPLPRHPASVDLMSGRHNLRCTCKTCVSRHRRRAPRMPSLTHLRLNSLR